MFWLLIFSPLLGALCSGGFGWLLGKKGSVFITISCMLLSVFCSVFFFCTTGLNMNSLSFKVGVWLFSEEFIVFWSFLIDSLTVTMFLVVNVVSLLVHAFSSEYLRDDGHLPRFMAYLSLFTFFMLILISSGNLIQLFLGWEGVGICSYLLINFWFHRVQANKAAIKALVVNKIGDLSFLSGIILVFLYTKTVDLVLLFNLAVKMSQERFLFLGYSFSPVTLASLFLVLGAVGKSAQIGLHTWLPDAMEGPTPVSALIHAATMVTAGVFLIIRTSPIIEKSNPWLLTVIVFFGSLTALLFAVVGMFQYDLKKIIAYSTCSQLGYMFFICGTSNYVLGIYHIFTHAGFKALLFLTAGSLIHSLRDEQDIRNMGGLIKFYPFYATLFIVSSLSLSGIPFLSGFYSKDLILELLNLTFVLKGSLAVVLGQLAAFASAFYSIRLVSICFFESHRSNSICKERLHKVSINYFMVLSFLCIASIFGGFLFFDLFYGTGSVFYTGFFVLDKGIVFENEKIFFLTKQLPLIFCLLSVFYYYKQAKNVWNNLTLLLIGNDIKALFIMRLGFDYLYNTYVSNLLLASSFFLTFKLLDKIALEVFGAKGLVFNSQRLALKAIWLQTGNLKDYIFSFFFLLNLLLVF